MTAITLELRPILHLTDEQYDQLCRMNPNLKFEQDKEGRLIIVPPTGGWSGNLDF
jgi:Uma2 family endonuclease